MANTVGEDPTNFRLLGAWMKIHREGDQWYDSRGQGQTESQLLILLSSRADTYQGPTCRGNCLWPAPYT